MNGLPLHPMVIHIPLALAFLVPVALLVIGVAAARGWLPTRAMWLVVALQAVLVASAWVGLQTGEREEDIVERVVPEALIEDHEHAAERFTLSAAITLALLLAAAVFTPPRAKLALGGTALATGLLSAALALDTGHKGGALVYTHNAASAYAHPQTTASLGEVRASRSSDDRDEDDD